MIEKTRRIRVNTHKRYRRVFHFYQNRIYFTWYSIYVIRAQNIVIKGLTNLTITMKSNSDKNQTKLPWWVELLFVQIGLPDSWLSKYLKKKKDAAKFINVNKKYIAYSAFLIAGIIYIYPIVKYTSSSSSCINRTTKYLKSNGMEKESEMDLNSIAVGYCHGGSLPE